MPAALPSDKFHPHPAAPPPRFMVVLDAAHGGDDTGGKLSDGQPEKAFTLALSVRLRSLLGARGMQVITTRESDATVDLNRRVEIANHASAQACLSLHASESGTGIHLFVSSLTPSPIQRGRPLSGVEDGAIGMGNAQRGTGWRTQLRSAA